MSFGDIAKLLASIDLDTRPFEKGSRRVGGDLSKMEGGLGRVSTRAIALGSAVGVGIERLAEKGISVLFDSIRSGEDALHTLQDAQAQTAAVIESTGGAAGVTAQQVRDLAEALESLTTVDDKNVQAGENVLLRFTAIGKDIFPQASKAATDLAVALAKGDAANADVSKSAAQIGKALQEPIKGLTSLRKAGVVFTAQEQTQIKAMVKSGDVMGAQEAVLKALEVRYGKAGEAAGETGASGIRRLNDAVEGAQIALAEGLSPALDEIRADIAKGLSNPSTQRDLRKLGVFLGDAAKSGLAFAKSVPWQQVGEGLKTAAGFAGNLIDAFAHMPPGVQATIIGLVGLNKLAGGGVIKVGVDLFKEGAQGIFKGLFQRGSSPANPLFVTGIGAGGLPVPLGGKNLLFTGLKVIIPALILEEALQEVFGDFGPSHERATGAVDRDPEGNIIPKRVWGPLKDIATNTKDTAENTSNKPSKRDVHLHHLAAMADQHERLVVKAQAGRDAAARDAHEAAVKQKAAIDAAKDKIEAARIAISSRQQDTTSKVGDLQRTTTSGTSQIVSAIQRSRPVVNVDVTVTGSNVKVDTTYSNGDMGGRTGGGARRR
jgi:hypothetical protein